MLLTATSLPVFLSLPFNTVPEVPFPNKSPSSKFKTSIYSNSY